ncbi:MAG: metallophosphoesterase [Erysipelotrichaceae bacterium]|nr:metallophosphoesterase [Erysipelotrichaceae bacterium]
MKKRIMYVLLVFISISILWILWGNKALEVNTYTISSNRLPIAFDGFTIAHISDFHNTNIGNKVLDNLDDTNVDIIVITGDIIDSRNTHPEIALEFVEELMKKEPCYYVSGNHEGRIDVYPAFKEDMKALGVHVLEDERVEVKKENDVISLIGVDDPSFQTDYLFGDDVTVMSTKLEQLKNEQYTILLSHRPELFDVYVKYDMDVVFSGHAHGGQFRLPFIGGLVAPNQGLFPKYDAGLFVEDNTHMIVSKGIGNSIIPMRFNNRPEVIVITLKSE